MSPQLPRTGDWFLHSGIQYIDGGVARYYLVDACRNLPASTEITGYSASTFVYLHSVTKDARYLDRAIAAARFLACAWDPASQTMPFEIEPAAFAYFFDCGIVVRGLLSVWRATGEREFLDLAVDVGESMARDFASSAGEFHPILALPGPNARAARSEPLVAHGRLLPVEIRHGMVGSLRGHPETRASSNPTSECSKRRCAHSAISFPGIPSARR